MSRRTRDVASALAVAVLFALPLLPEILGARRLIFRDALVTHWPWRRVAVASLSRGEVPFFSAEASGGQPLLANPNAVLLYPTFLLERVLSPASAFNLHYLVHVFWAFLGARVLARRLGLPEGAAFFSGVAFAFSGMLLSYGSAFMNSGAAAAWLPWCAAAAVDLARASGARPRLRAAAAASLALGLQLLAGEPAITALTAACITALALVEAWPGAAADRWRRLAGLVAGGLLAGAIALGVAAPLLLTLRQVFPLTLRGQHLYSKSAFGAAPFTTWRLIEWLLPRFRGNPSQAATESSWLHHSNSEPFVYIWCVTLGVIPLAAIAMASVSKGFWTRRRAALALGGALSLAVSFGFALPFYRLLYEVPVLRRLRYPIKFYLVTTLCASLLAGVSLAFLIRRRPDKRAAAVAIGFLVLFGAAWLAAAPSGAIDHRAAEALGERSGYYQPIVAAFRALVRGDAAMGAAGVLLLALLLRWAPKDIDRGYLLGFATLCCALAWGLQLFASGSATELSRAPALRKRLEGPGRLFAPSPPRLFLEALEPTYPKKLPTFASAARVRIERLFPLTGASFGVPYLFEMDPDGSYGYYNRVVTEAAVAAEPIARDRLLRAFGARWLLVPEGEEHPLYRAATGLSIAHERMVLFEDPNPVPELRWAGRVFRRQSLTGTLELLEADAFDPMTDVTLPGKTDLAPESAPTQARVSADLVGSDRVRAHVEADGDGYVVFSRTYFPAWKARLDGRTVPVLVANARDLAVAVPAGRHEVEIAYDRMPFRLGVGIQATTFLAALGIAVAARRRTPTAP